MRKLWELEAEARRLSREEFVARYPAPGLLIDVMQDGAGESESETQTTAIIQKTLPLSGAAAGPDLGEGLKGKFVAFLLKSERNKFRNIIILGRADFADIVIKVPTISKIHVSFTQLTERWHVVHRGATNGLTVDGQVISSEHYVKLNSGMSLSFGPEVYCMFYSSAKLYELLRAAAS